MRFMKKLYIAACAALLVGATACENNRDANLTEAYVYIVNEGYQVAEFYDLDKEPEASIAIHRSGYFESNATVTAAIDLEAIAKYNAENGTSYEALTEGTYWLTESEVAINGSERTGIIGVGFDYETIAALTDGHNYVVPVRITSDAKVNESKSLVLISPILKPAEVFFMPNREETVKWSSSSAYVYKKELTISVPFDNPIDCTITLDTSKAQLKNFDKYLNYAPEEAFTIVGEPVLMAGQSQVKVTLEVDLSKLPENTYRCSIPVVMTANSEKYAINSDNRYILLHLQQDGVTPVKVDAGDRQSIWTMHECNSCHTMGTPNSYWCMIDGNAETFWHSGYSSSSVIADVISCSKDNPYIVAWDMGKAHNLVGVELLRRNYKDYVAGYIEVSFDGYDWTKVADFDHITQCNGDQTLVGPFYYEFSGDANVQYVRVCVTNCARGTAAAQYANIAELDVYEVKLATE